MIITYFLNVRNSVAVVPLVTFNLAVKKLVYIPVVINNKTASKKILSLLVISKNYNIKFIVKPIYKTYMEFVSL